MTKIRVVEIFTGGFVSPTVTEKVIWEGTSVEELSRDYTPSTESSCDKLKSYEAENGLLRCDFKYKHIENGEWVEIDDPRVRNTPPTAREQRLIDERRRRYPRAQ